MELKFKQNTGRAGKVGHELVGGVQGLSVELVTVTLWMASEDSNLSQSKVPP
jgi:hypothetical protein